MKLRTRIGTATLAGMYAVSVLGAVQPEVGDTPEPTPSESTSTTPRTSAPADSPDNELSDTPPPETTEAETEQDPPAPPPSDDEASEPSLEETNCHVVGAENSTATIEIPAADADDQVEIVGHGSYQVDESSQIQVPYDEATTLEMTIWHGAVQEFAQCEVTVEADEEEPPDEPTGTPTTEPPTDEPGDGSPDPEETGLTTPAPSPPESTLPPDDTTPPPDDTTPPTTPETFDPGESPTQQPPSSPTQSPVAPQPSQETGWDDASVQPSQPTQQPTTQPPAPIERNIRPHSDDPRRLLSQIWDTDSHDGSGLIMPEPRDTSGGPAELETLPPVSADELEAIKARVASPDKGNGLGADDVGADANERLAHSDSWWLISSVIGLVLIGSGVWWIAARRKPQH